MFCIYQEASPLFLETNYAMNVIDFPGSYTWNRLKTVSFESSLKLRAGEILLAGRGWSRHIVCRAGNESKSGWRVSSATLESWWCCYRAGEGAVVSANWRPHHNTPLSIPLPTHQQQPGPHHAKLLLHPTPRTTSIFHTTLLADLKLQLVASSSPQNTQNPSTTHSTKLLLHIQPLPLK